MREVVRGEPWSRIFPARHPDPLGWTASNGRFTSRASALGAVYLARNLRTSFVEAVLRDRGDGRVADIVVSMVKLQSLAHAVVSPVRPLRVVDLTGDGCLLMGIPTDVRGARDQDLGRIWGAALREHDEAPDGILHPSRFTGEDCLTVFDRSLGAMEVVDVAPLVERRDELAEIIGRYAIAIEP